MTKSEGLWVKTSRKAANEPEDMGNEMKRKHTEEEKETTCAARQGASCCDADTATADDAANDENIVVSDKADEKEDASGKDDIILELKKSLEDKTGECERLYSTLQRTAADFDNFRKRTAKEKESIYADAAAEVAAVFLPIADNLERALESVTGNTDPDSIKSGIELIIKQLLGILDDIKVKEIEALGKKFDPQMHNAVLHIEGDEYGENEVVEVLQKGYVMNGKILRHSMVKVAN